MRSGWDDQALQQAAAAGLRSIKQSYGGVTLSLGLPPLGEGDRGIVYPLQGDTTGLPPGLGPLCLKVAKQQPVCRERLIEEGMTTDFFLSEDIYVPKIYYLDPLGRFLRQGFQDEFGRRIVFKHIRADEDGFPRVHDLLEQNGIRVHPVKIELNIVAFRRTGDTMAGQYRFDRIEAERIRRMLFMEYQGTFLAFLPYLPVSENKIEDESGKREYQYGQKQNG